MRVVVGVLALTLVFAGCFGGSNDSNPDGEGTNPEGTDPDCTESGDASQIAEGESNGDETADEADNSSAADTLFTSRQTEDNSTVGPGDNETQDDTDPSIYASGAGCPDEGGEGEGEGVDEPEVIGDITIQLTANVTEGVAPFDVTFNFNGSVADGSDLTWTLDANGDGTEETSGAALPGNFSYSFTEVGNFTAIFMITSGDQNATTNVTISALEPEIVEEEEPAGPYFFDDADDNAQEWTFGRSASPTNILMGDFHQSSANAASGTQAWAAHMESTGGYTDMINIWMDSPVIDLSAASSARLKVQVMGGSEEGYDYGIILVSKDGENFSELAKFSGTMESFEEFSYDLNSYAGGDLTIRFQMTSDDNCSGTTPLCDDTQLGPGWFFDDITVQ